ncbi:hypothetical protein [Sphingomonas endophytica]|nr:hypothetical protein [Sphingomonas endophytica]
MRALFKLVEMTRIARATPKVARQDLGVANRKIQMVGGGAPLRSRGSRSGASVRTGVCATARIAHRRDLLIRGRRARL